MNYRFAALLLLSPLLAAAHEVPDEVTVRIFLRPAQDKMLALVRIPVNALIDFQFPLLGETNFLDIPGTNELMPDAAQVWATQLLSVYEGDTPLPRFTVLKTLLSRDSDPSFNTSLNGSWDQALAHIDGPPLPPNAVVLLDRGQMDVLLEAPIRSARSDFSLVPRFGRLGVLVTNYVTFLPAASGARSYTYEGDPPQYLLDPSPIAAARLFGRIGFRHLFDETDHALFLLGLVLLFSAGPMWGARDLIPFLIAFSATHSLVLLASVLSPAPGPVWLPRVAGTLAALLIVYLGLECAIPATPRRYRPLVAVWSGLVFGATFWYFLQPSLQFGGNHPVISTLAFNAGVEAGQILALVVMVAAAGLFFRFTPRRRMWTIVFAGFAAHIAWHRMTERAFSLNRLPFSWPSPQIWTAVLLAGTIALIPALFRRRKETNPS